MRLILKITMLLGLLATACTKDPPPVTPKQKRQLVLEVLASNLQLPWGLAWLPNGDLLFTERVGKVSLLPQGSSTPQVLMTRPVYQGGESGLLSIAVDPVFTTNHFVYIYETTDSNRVWRLLLQNGTLTEDKVIVPGIPRAPDHDGGALKFGPDGFLYIGTGDVTQPPLAQDKSSLAGKILRVDRDGNAAPGNPFNNKIWSYGHRNVQGICWTGSGQMLATEHGPSGELGWCCHDEVNHIVAGNNYGWPLALAGTESDTLTPPLINSGYDTWAPSGCTYLGPQAIWPNCLVVCALRGQRLIRLYTGAGAMAITATADTLQGQLNRLRNVIEAPDHSLIFCSGNYGLVTPMLAGDDKIYRLYIK